MKKAISIIVAIGFVSSMLVNSAYAGGRNCGGISPLWIPVAILSTLAAVTIAQPQPVAYERRITYEPRLIVVSEEPKYNRHAHDYEFDHTYEARRHRDNR